MQILVELTKKDVLYLLSNDLDAGELLSNTLKNAREKGKTKNDYAKNYVLTDKTWHYLALLGDGLLQPRQGLISKDYHKAMPQASYYKMLEILQIPKIGRHQAADSVLRQLPITAVDEELKRGVVAVLERGETDMRELFEQLYLTWKDFPKLFACFYSIGVKHRIFTNKEGYCQLFLKLQDLI